MYAVYCDPECEALFMIAPFDVLARVLNLRKPAHDRVLRETRDGGVCYLCFNGKAPFGHDNLYVKATRDH